MAFRAIATRNQARNSSSIVVNASRYEHLRQLYDSGSLRLVQLPNLADRVATWDLLINATHAIQRHDEPIRLAARATARHRCPSGSRAGGTGTGTVTGAGTSAGAGTQTSDAHDSTGSSSRSRSGSSDSSSSTRDVEVPSVSLVARHGTSHLGRPKAFVSQQELQSGWAPTYGRALQQHVHLVASVVDGEMPSFAHGLAGDVSAYNLTLVIYNKTRASMHGDSLIVSAGLDRHDIPFTGHTRNCAAYARYVDEYYDRLPEVALLVKTNQVRAEQVRFLLQTARDHTNDVDSHPWFKLNPRSFIVVRCDARWAALATALYQLLCPCADEQLDFEIGRVRHKRTNFVKCSTPVGHDQRHPRSRRLRPLVEEFFSEGLFGFARCTLRQHPRHVYRRWHQALEAQGEAHAECLDEWITMFDEDGDAPHGRDGDGIPVWRSSPSRLRYPGFLLHR